MANKFNGFLDSLVNAALNPKGNLGDFAHAARLYTDSNLALAPKTKFLYHVFLEIDPNAAGLIQSLDAKKVNEMGMLVKNAELPKYRSTVTQKKKYNRIKNVQTGIEYDPVRITFHDDNSSLTTALMQAYYRFYFADGNQRRDNGRAYAKVPDSTYEGSSRNKYKFGLDNNNPGVPFFKSIQISQLSRGGYVTYTLVNPIVTNWGHDRLDNSDGQGTMENFMEIAYESVFYDSGRIEGGANGEPNGFGQDHYDNTPSPITLQGGQVNDIGAIIGGVIDIYDYIANGESFDNPLEAVIVAANLFGSIRELSTDGLREQGLNIISSALLKTAFGTSGVSDTLFPKTGGLGADSDLVLATTGGLNVAAFNASQARQQLANDPAALEAAAKKLFNKDFQNAGGVGGVNGANAAYSALPESTKQGYRDQALGA